VERRAAPIAKVFLQTDKNGAGAGRLASAEQDCRPESAAPRHPMGPPQRQGVEVMRLPIRQGADDPAAARVTNNGAASGGQ